MTIRAINPATGEVVSTHDEMTPDAVGEIIEDVHEAFLDWRRASFADRAAPLRKAARDPARATPASTRASWRGRWASPCSEGAAEARRMRHRLRFLRRERRAFPGPRDRSRPTRARASSTFNPLGVVLAVMPWNFPFWQVFRFAAPGLMAGNAAVLKHASNVPGCALAIEEIFRRAGFPENLFRALMIGSGQVEAVIENPFVRAATLTGSGPAGRAVARKAGELLKKTVLELGGSDPYLILEDADLELAANVSAKGRLINSGQSCIAAKRFLAVEKIRRRFEELFVEKMSAAKMGDPLAEDTQVGPQARHELRDDLHRQVEASLAGGARLPARRRDPSGTRRLLSSDGAHRRAKGDAGLRRGALRTCRGDHPGRRRGRGDRAANDSAFGLGGAVLTRDLARGERIAAELIESGCVFVNEAVKSDPRLPFGGVKESGYGRELSSYGIKEFVNIKTVYVA